MLTQLYENKSLDEQIQAEYVFPSLCSTEILSHFVYDICDLSQIQLDSFSLEIQELNLYDLLQNCISFFVFQSYNQKISMVLDIK